jgi:hypothetical protein
MLGTLKQGHIRPSLWDTGCWKQKNGEPAAGFADF